MALDKLRKYLFHLRKGGIKGIIKFIKLNKFEEKIFRKKKLKWNSLGYWQVDPMPTEDELLKFYSQIYWVSNQYYKSNLLIPRDLDHVFFLENRISNKMIKNSNFMNFGAGHGGISYLMAAKKMNVINIEPSTIFSANIENFSNFNKIENFFEVSNDYPKIDILYSSHVVEHLADPINFFKKISKILDKDAKVFIEVPNCRKSNITKDYVEGGCDGKITGSHLVYFTKDFFENLNSKIYFFKEQESGNKYTEVDNEDEADCIRVIITAENIKNWIKKF
tara:strand:+ start:1874 stop:2707 length:834 start_codon:yes stop_codon:yes gene_type:complete